MASSFFSNCCTTTTKKCPFLFHLLKSSTYFITRHLSKKVCRIFLLFLVSAVVWEPAVSNSVITILSTYLYLWSWLSAFHSFLRLSFKLTDFSEACFHPSRLSNVLNIMLDSSFNKHPLLLQLRFLMRYCIMKKHKLILYHSQHGIPQNSIGIHLWRRIDQKWAIVI